jgi:DNA repair exonuclease SbcCD ATPase subunit
MNTKISVLLFAHLLSSTTLFYSCSPSERKNTQAEVNEEMSEVNKEITETSAKFKQERAEWRSQMSIKMAKWDARLAELDTKIEAQGDKASAQLKQERKELGEAYAELKTNMAKAENKTESEWADFKSDVNKTADKMATDVDNFFKRIDINGDGK